jgi:hypothetical protein
MDDDRDNTLSVNAAFLDDCNIFDTCGIAIKAIIANTTITANNSTNVNPFFFILCSYFPLLCIFILTL